MNKEMQQLLEDNVRSERILHQVQREHQESEAKLKQEMQQLLQDNERMDQELDELRIRKNRNWIYKVLRAVLNID